MTCHERGNVRDGVLRSVNPNLDEWRNSEGTALVIDRDRTTPPCRRNPAGPACCGDHQTRRARLCPLNIGE